ncbi:MAG: methyl-accepting chemotaxis protein, partial [Fimbriimonadales bacterium]
GAQQQASAVGQATTLVERVGESIRSTTQQVNEMGNQSEQINAMVEVINQIAFQTHLLALNAAIEAARAGEAGRGFAVVAKEVQQLAERSAQSAKDVGAIVNRVRKSVQDTVASMSQASQQFEQELVRAIASISEVVKQYQQVVSDMIREADTIKRTVDEIASTGEQTSAAAQEVSASTQQMSAQSEQVARLADHLQTISQTLSDALQNFRQSQSEQTAQYAA